MLLPWIPALKASDGKAHAPKQPNNVFSTTVETWKYYDKLVRCPACNVKDVPIILKQQNFTSSRLAAFCLLGCWPFCFIPLLMSRDKKMRMQCPHCNHDYDIRTDQLACSPKCQSSRGESSKLANSRQSHLQMECNGSQIQSEYRYCQHHSSPYQGGSSDNCANERRNCRCGSNEPKVLKAPGRSESEDSSRTGMIDFYARQVCCRECG